MTELRELSRLHQGEAELIEVANRSPDTDAHLLIDEGRAFNYLRDNGIPNLLCLAQVLHQLEDWGHIQSCQSIMNKLVEPKKYLWAKAVRRHYDA